MHLRIPVFLALFSLISASALAADDSFVGKWKLNSDKSQFAGLEYKIEDAGGGQRVHDRPANAPAPAGYDRNSTGQPSILKSWSAHPEMQ